MFNFKEIQTIHDALQNYPIALNRTDIIKKIFSMVSQTTWESVAPCVRAFNPNKPGDTDFRERIVVFESERELLRLLEEVAMKKESDAGHQFVVVHVPSPGLAERIGEEIWRYIGSRFEPRHYYLDRNKIELRNGLHIDVEHKGNYGMGITYEWAFLYNEVSGF